MDAYAFASRAAEGGNMKTILFVLALFLAIWFSTLVIIRGVRGQKIHAMTFAIMSASVTAVITHIMGVW